MQSTRLDNRLGLLFGLGLLALADAAPEFRSPDLQDFNVTPARKNGAPTYGRRSGGELVASGLLCSRLANGAQRSGIYYETNS